MIKFRQSRTDNPFQGPKPHGKVMRERRKAKGKERADPEDDLEISELPEQFHNSLNLAWSIVGRDTIGGPNQRRHRWSKLIHKTDELHTLVNTDLVEPDLDRRFSHLFQVIPAHTQRTSAPTRPTPALPTRFSSAALAESQDVFRALARVEAALPANQVSAAASRAARDV